MKTILLTIDTEFYISEEEILGIDGSHGLDDILQILDDFAVKATFFIDYFSIKKWGEDIFTLIHQKISAGGHDIQLHMHPYIFGGKNYLWQYTDQEQELYLDKAIAYYKKYNLTRPLFFRAGGYAANDQTLALLKEKGIFG